MKNETVAKINKIGRIGWIVTNVAKVIIIIAFIVIMIAFALFTALPQGFLNIEMSYSANVNINFDDVKLFNNIMPIDISKLDIDDIDFNINGFDFDVAEITADGADFNIDTQAESIEFNLKKLNIIMIMVGLYIIAMYVVLHFLGKILKLFRCCTTPFTDEIVMSVRNLAIAIVPMAMISGINETMVNYFLFGKTDIIIGIDLAVVVLVVLVFLLAAVFKYGTMLQTESDETL